MHFFRLLTRITLLLLAGLLAGLVSAGSIGRAAGAGVLTFYLDDARHPGLYLLDVHTGTLHRFNAQVRESGMFAWSPDGEHLAVPLPPVVELKQFSDEDFVETIIQPGQFIILGMDGREVRRISTENVSAEHPRWSPDGAWLAFEADTDTGMLDLFVVDVAGNMPPRNLTYTASSMEEYAAWSPDSHRIAYQSIDFQGFRINAPRYIYLVNADGTGRRRVYDNGFFPAWSPDGRQLLYFYWGEERELRLTDFQGLPVKLDTALYSAVAWSPDGTRLAYVRQTGGQFVIRLKDAAGQSWQDIPTDFASVTSPVWSPDSRYLAVAALHGQTYGLYVVDAVSGAIRRLLHTPQLIFPVWKPEQSF